MSFSLQTFDKNGNPVSKEIPTDDKWSAFDLEKLPNEGLSNIFQTIVSFGDTLRSFSTGLEGLSNAMQVFKSAIQVGGLVSLQSALKILLQEIEDLINDLKNTDVFVLPIVPKESVSFSEFAKNNRSTDDFLQTIKDSFIDIGDLNRPQFSDSAFVGGVIFYLPIPRPLDAIDDITKFTKVFFDGLIADSQPLKKLVADLNSVPRVQTIVSANVLNSTIQEQFNKSKSVLVGESSSATEVFHWVLPVDNSSEFRPNSLIQIGGSIDPETNKFVKDPNNEAMVFLVSDSKPGELQIEAPVRPSRENDLELFLKDTEKVQTVPFRNISEGELVLNLDSELYEPQPLLSTKTTTISSKGDVTLHVNDTGGFPKSGHILIQGGGIPEGTAQGGTFQQNTEIVEYSNLSRFEFILADGVILQSNHNSGKLVIPTTAPSLNEHPDWSRLLFVQSIPLVNDLFLVLDKILNLLNVADDIIDVLVAFIDVIVDMISTIQQFIDDITNLIQAFADLFSGKIGFSLLMEPKIGGVNGFITRIDSADKIQSQRTFYDYTIGENTTISVEDPDISGELSTHLGIVFLVGAPSLEGVKGAFNVLSKVFTGEELDEEDKVGGGTEANTQELEITLPEFPVVDESGIPIKQEEDMTDTEKSNQYDAQGEAQINSTDSNDSISPIQNTSTETVPGCGFNDPITVQPIVEETADEITPIQSTLNELQETIQTAIDELTPPLEEEEEPAIEEEQPIEIPSPDNSTNFGDNVIGETPNIVSGPSDNTLSERWNDIYLIPEENEDLASNGEEISAKVIGDGRGKVEHSGLTDVVLLNGDISKEISVRFIIEEISVLESPENDAKII